MTGRVGVGEGVTGRVGVGEKGDRACRGGESVGKIMTKIPIRTVMV